MHSIILTSCIALLLLVEWAGAGLSQLSQGQVSICLALAVAAIGLPHGALDYRRKLQSKILGMSFASWSIVVLYLGVALLVVAGWYVVPQFTVLAFFLLSAWHFGHDERVGVPARIRPVAQIARGGMVVWITCLFRGGDVQSLLARIIPEDGSASASAIVTAVQISTPIFATILVVDLVCTILIAKTKQDLLAASADVLRLSACGVMFATLPVLVSFGTFFCGWHSVRELQELKRTLGTSWLGLIRTLAPMSLAAVALLAGGFAIWQGSETTTNALIRTVFVGLSALAVPHLILHLAEHRPERHVGLTLEASRP